ncbi:MAG: type III-A CRISPR-associated protein Csm2 [Candidatus Verstraetearchaeota archaeon]|nr:type III-A CRISPR-associated protein Csm2 [Candidatus Verstraetearchaeota archaeon]
MGMKPFFKGQGYSRDYSRDYRGGQPRDRGSSLPLRGVPEQNNEIVEVRSAITKLNRMSDLKAKDFADLEGYAAKVAKSLGKESNSQLRKFFEPLVEIESRLKRGESWGKLEGKLHMSIPMLAYAVGRDLVPRSFFELMEVCIKKVVVEGDTDDQKKESFGRFMEFLRAIVAYNKYFKG